MRLELPYLFQVTSHPPVVAPRLLSSYIIVIVQMFPSFAPFEGSALPVLLKKLLLALSLSQKSSPPNIKPSSRQQGAGRRYHQPPGAPAAGRAAPQRADPLRAPGERTFGGDVEELRDAPAVVLARCLDFLYG